MRACRFVTSEPVHIGATIGMRILERADGRAVIGWDAQAEYGFPAASGQIIHGGMVTTILDTAMGAATWSSLTADEVFLTADLRVEFYRATRPGPLVAKGLVIKRTSRLAFCSAELFDADDRLLAGARATQTILPAQGAMARPDPTTREFMP
ncbi:MAG: PaaI family thioesterase [Frankiales bacterium]|nr:PaaI family thioesterase [Frankiales bacterium]